jgi:membrane protease YdiL (CAAX protease family)
MDVGRLPNGFVKPDSGALRGIKAVKSALVYAIVGISVAVRAYSQRACRDQQSVVDLGDLILVAIFAGVWLVKRQDPVDFLGIAARLDDRQMALMAGLVVPALGLVNSRIHAWLKQAHGGWMSEAGVNPGGAYLALAGMPKRIAILLGLGFIASGALLEEILFRGFLLQWASEASGLVNGVVAQAVLFGLAHGVPMACVRAPHVITLYALLMPTACGIVLGWLAVKSGGLACPWLAHWALNYFAFVVEIKTLPP